MNSPDSHSRADDQDQQRAIQQCRLSYFAKALQWLLSTLFQPNCLPS